MISMFSFLGTFAVISLMTAQAIEGVTHPSIDHKPMSSSFSNASDSSLLSDKISIATTLALLVGFVQVGLNREEIDDMDSLVDHSSVSTIGIFNGVFNRTIYQWFYYRCGYSCFD